MNKNPYIFTNAQNQAYNYILIDNLLPVIYNATVTITQE